MGCAVQIFRIYWVYQNLYNRKILNKKECQTCYSIQIFTIFAL